MTTITTRTVEYPADGLTMIGYLALPAGVDRRPAVLLGPEGMGLSDVERRRADALAELGYVALAFDLHGGRYLGDPEEMLARCMPLLADPDRMRGIGHAALEVLRAEPRTDPDRIAAVGYGTGGAIGLELGRDGVNLRAIGTVNALTTGRPGEAARIRCPVWAGVGSEDPIMPPAQRDAFTAEMQAAGVDWRLVVYGGALHAFHHPPVDHPTRPRRRLPPTARAASLARHRRPARRVPARNGVIWSVQARPPADQRFPVTTAHFWSVGSRLFLQRRRTPTTRSLPKIGAYTQRSGVTRGCRPTSRPLSENR